MINLPVFGAGPECNGCGECCKRAPGASFPDDWRKGDALDEDAIREALASGRWVADHWVGDPRPGRRFTTEIFPYLRPAVVGFEGDVLASSWDGMNGRCTFLGEGGCTSTRKPAECSALKPGSPEQGCEVEVPRGYANARQLAARLWMPHRKRLNELVKEASR